MIQEMFNRARALGLEPYGSNVRGPKSTAIAADLRTCTSWSMRAADIPRARMSPGWANGPSGPSPSLRVISELSSRHPFFEGKEAFLVRHLVVLVGVLR